VDDIEAHERRYRGSDEETRELKELYARFEGDMDQCVRPAFKRASDLADTHATTQSLFLAVLFAGRHGLASFHGDIASCHQCRRVAL